MEVPVKRARLAPRELKLLDLDDDALILIIDKLDHRSKLQMMATCKRFEGLIGHTHQFYKNFKFRYNRRRFPEYRYLGMVRRKFGIVEIFSGEELSPAILKFLSKTGAHILKIKFHNVIFENLTFENSDFFDLMKALPKLEELEINESFFTKSYSGENCMDFKLEHLTKLEINGSLELQAFAAFVPASLKNFEVEIRRLKVERMLGC
jgi:hypothetical protein